MKSTMTERDKKLLVAMFIGVIIVAIGYWGIRPQVKRYKELESLIEKEESKQKINKTKITNLSVVELQADDYAEKIDEIKDEYYQTMNSSELDRMMTELATSNDLDIYELKFSFQTSPTDRMAYKNSSLYATQQKQKAEYSKKKSSTKENSKSSDGDDKSDKEDKDEKEKTSAKSSGKKDTTTADVMNEVMGGEEGGYQPNTDIYAVPVTMTVGGEIENLNGFIDDLVNMDKRILFVGYSWGEFRNIVRRDSEGNIISDAAASSDSSQGEASEEQDGTTVEVVVRKSLTVRLEIYMCDTASVEKINGGSENSKEDNAEDSAESETTENSSEMDELDQLLDD